MTGSYGTSGRLIAGDRGTEGSGRGTGEGRKSSDRDTKNISVAGGYGTGDRLVANGRGTRNVSAVIAVRGAYQ